ncbi:MAG: DUF6731 family protein [Verrucomicrobiota bacterium]
MRRILLEIASKPLDKREKAVNGRTIRLEELERVVIGGKKYFAGCLAQLRSMALPSKVRKGSPLSDLGLDSEESLAEPTGFLYLPEKDRLVYSRIQSSVVIGNFQRYLSAFAEKGVVHVTPVIRTDALERVKKSSWLNRMDLKFQMPSDGKIPQTSSGSIGGAIKAASSVGGAVVKLSISAKAGKNDHLSKSSVISDAEQIIAEAEQHQIALDALDIHANVEGTERAEKIPLLNFSVQNWQDIENATRTLTWKTLKNAAIRAAREIQM